jgi:hypothetical protein
MREIYFTKLKVDPVENKLAQYKQKWLYYVIRMEDIMYPRQLLDCPPIGRRRRPGRLLKTDSIMRLIGDLLGSIRDQMKKTWTNVKETTRRIQL